MPGSKPSFCDTCTAQLLTSGLHCNGAPGQGGCSLYRQLCHFAVAEDPGSVQQQCRVQKSWQRAAAVQRGSRLRPSHWLQTNEIPQCFSSLPEGVGWYGQLLLSSPAMDEQERGQLPPSMQHFTRQCAAGVTTGQRMAQGLSPPTAGLAASPGRTC